MPDHYALTKHGLQKSATQVPGSPGFFLRPVINKIIESPLDQR